MRSRRSMDVRARSPPLRTRDRRSNEGGLDDYLPPRDYNREVREQRSLRDLSPRGQERSWRILVRNRRSSSLEARDYSRHFDGGRESGDYSLDNGNRMPLIGLSYERSQFDEGVRRRVESPSVEYRKKYLMMESMGLNADLNPMLKYAGGCEPREKDFQGSSSSFHNEREMLLQKAVHLDNRAERTFFTLPPDHSHGGSFLSSTGNYNAGYHKDESFRYEEDRKLEPMPVRKSHNEEEKQMLYSSDVYYPTVQISHSEAFESTSSGLTKGDVYHAYEGSRTLPSDQFDNVSGKYTESFRGDGLSRAHTFDIAREPKDFTSSHRELLGSSRGENWDYNYHELGRREKEGRKFPSDEFYSMSTRGEYANRDISRPSYIDMDVDRYEDMKRSHKEILKSDLWDQHSLQRETVPGYFDVKRTSLATEKDADFLGIGHKYLEFGVGVSENDEITRVEGSYGFGREADPGSHKEILNSRSIFKNNLNTYGLDASPKQRLKAEELDRYSPSERMLKRKYIVEEDLDARCSQRSVLNSRDISRRVREMSDSDEPRTSKIGGLILSKGSKYGRLRHIKSERLHERMGSKRDLMTQDLSLNVQGHDMEHHIPGGRNVSIKKRLKPASMNMHYMHHIDRRQDFRKPYKFWRRSLDDQYDTVRAHNDSSSVDWVAPAKSDPPEDSDEFKQLVHRAFLRFSKQLNENPAQRRRYKEQGKAGSLFCSVCGSFSKEFVDTHSLVVHTFMSQRVGLKTEHLGLHKALCVLMGWSSDVEDGGKWIQQVLPNSEALALKEDLVLWPPLVIIHNASIENKNPDRRHIVTIEEMTAIIRDMGFSGGTVKVFRGKPANQSIMVVKFLPTFSGLQEAEKLHKYYIDQKRGREEFQQQQVNPEEKSGSESEEKGGVAAEGGKVELVLYGYLGLAHDLDKLDFGTKKKCLVKSKKDIQAIADAPLKNA